MAAEAAASGASGASGGGMGGGGMLEMGGKFFDFAGTMFEAYASAQAHEFNATVATQNAALVRQSALAEVARMRRQTTKDLGSMRASYGAAGVTASGSVLDAMMDAATQHELDIQTTRWQAEVAAVGFENQARLSDSAAKGAMIGGALGALGGLLG